jgi:hypothetical protein
MHLSDEGAVIASSENSNNGLTNSYPAFSQVENRTGIWGRTWRARLQFVWSEAYLYQKTLWNKLKGFWATAEEP